MSKSSEDLIDERRSGFVTGLAVSELMLLILFALLLFMVEGLVNNNEDRNIIEGLGGKDVAENLERAVRESPEMRRILREDPEIIDLWITLTTAGALSATSENRELVDELSKSLAEMERDRQKLVSQLAEQAAETAEINERLIAANSALMEGVRMGGTTLCTYSSPTSDSPRPRSVPLGVVFLEQNGITLLSTGYENEQLIDAYGEVIDPMRAEEIISGWAINEKISFDEFQRLNTRLVDLGDQYSTESRQNCRYYFDYYFDDINANTLDLWNRLNYSGVKISTSRFAELVTRNAINHP